MFLYFSVVITVVIHSGYYSPTPTSSTPRTVCNDDRACVAQGSTFCDTGARIINNRSYNCSATNAPYTEFATVTYNVDAQSGESNMIVWTEDTGKLLRFLGWYSASCQLFFFTKMHPRA